MFIKLSFQEHTHPKCMSLELDYELTKNPELVKELPPGVEANKQVRIPDEPALNDMFGPFNACHYDYYLDCGDVDEKTIEKTVLLLGVACNGKLPKMDADSQYLTKNENLIVQGLKFALNTLIKDKNISPVTFVEMFQNELRAQVQQHEEESMAEFFSQILDDQGMEELREESKKLADSEDPDEKAEAEGINQLLSKIALEKKTDKKNQSEINQEQNIFKLFGSTPPNSPKNDAHIQENLSKNLQESSPKMGKK